ncbi:type II secretion system F family protein [Blastococcus litoris]|uniref:type II secretion system F family protein n=1 Tax=Blastococcus litoris TaxID=2171622 RepID=UPI000E308A00|nr:type II secretion system F family protein [Blastococcus litoris]
MTPVVMLGVFSVAAAIGCLTYTLVGHSGRALAIARRNLTRGLATTTVEVGSLESRGSGSSALLRVITPDAEARRARRLLQVAGYPHGLTLTRVLWAKLVLAGVVALVGLALLASGGGLLTWVLVPLAVVGAYRLPEAILWGRGQERRKTITHELPDLLDQMTIAVAAGLGFEAALARAAANGRGPLADELSRTLHDVAVGRSRREAYNALVARTDVPDLKRFVAAVNQADAYGIAIADVLKVQAAEMRVKRRQRAEEQAMKVPVKVTFPLMLCFLPALLITVVGPAVMGLVDSLG